MGRNNKPEPNVGRHLAMWNAHWKLLAGGVTNSHINPNNVPKKRKRAVNNLLWKHAKHIKPRAFRGGTNNA